MKERGGSILRGFFRARVPEPVKDADEAPAEVSEGGDTAAALKLAEHAEELEGNPNDETGAGGEIYPGVAHEKAEAGVWKGEGVKRDDSGNAATGADGGQFTAGFGQGMEDVAGERAEKKDHQETFAANEVFNIVAKDEEKIEISEEVDEVGVNEE